MSKPSRKLVIGAIGALTVGATILATLTPAEAQWRHRGWRGPGPGAAIVGGLALGALAGAAIARPYYYGPPAYYTPQTYYVDQPVCQIVREPLYNRHGQVVSYRRVRVCD